MITHAITSISEDMRCARLDGTRTVTPLTPSLFQKSSEATERTTSLLIHQKFTTFFATADNSMDTYITHTCTPNDNNSVGLIPVNNDVNSASLQTCFSFLRSNSTQWNLENCKAVITKFQKEHNTHDKRNEFECGHASHWSTIQETESRMRHCALRPSL